MATTVAAIYASGLFWFPNRPVFWSPDEGGRYLDMRQIAEHNRWRNPLPYPGAFLDPHLSHVPLQYWLVNEGELYSWWPSTFPAISSVPYRLLGLQGIYLIPLLGSVMVSLTVYRVLASRSRLPGLVAMGVTAFASPMAFYGFTFWEHTLGTWLVLLASVSATRSWMRQAPRWSGLAGILLGLATCLRIETVLFAGAVGLAGALWMWRQCKSRPRTSQAFHTLCWLACGYLLAVAPLLLSGPADETHYLEVHYSARLRVQDLLHRHPQLALESLPNVLIGTSAHGSTDIDPRLRWLGTAAAVAAFLVGLAARGPTVWLFHISTGVLLALSGMVLLDASLYLSLHGLVLITPYIAFAGWSLRSSAREPALAWGYVSLSFVVSYLATTMIAGWEGQGGLQWGPRYALPLVPVMIISTFHGLRELMEDRRLSRIFKWTSIAVLFVMALMGAGFQARGVGLMREIKWQVAFWERKLETLPEDALIVTDSPVLASNMPGLYEKRVILRLADGESLPNGWRIRARRADFNRICRITGFATGRLDTICSDVEEFR